jgi:hypothetical protein
MIGARSHSDNLPLMRRQRGHEALHQPLKHRDVEINGHGMAQWHEVEDRIQPRLSPRLTDTAQTRLGRAFQNQRHRTADL